MDDIDDEEFMQIMINSQKKACEVAIETAIRTGTSLVVSRNGKIVRVKPKFKYVLVPIRKKRNSKKRSVKT